MSADTREENKAVEAMVAAHCFSPGGCLCDSPKQCEIVRDHYQDQHDAMRASLLALADTVTDEMAERGGRALLLNVGWRPEEITALKATQDLVWQSAKAHARVVFVKMCRAAAGGGGHD